MQKTFLKFLPLAAAVLIATSCSKSDNDGEIKTDTVVEESEFTLPFSITAGTEQSISKVTYGFSGHGNTTDKLKFDGSEKLTISTKSGTELATLENPTLAANKESATFNGKLRCENEELMTQIKNGEVKLVASIGSPVENVAVYSSMDDAVSNSYQCSEAFKYNAEGNDDIELIEQNAYLYIRGTYITDITVYWNGDATGTKYTGNAYGTDSYYCFVCPAGTKLTKIQANGDEHPLSFSKISGEQTLSQGKVYMIDRLKQLTTFDNGYTCSFKANGGESNSTTPISPLTFGQRVESPSKTAYTRVGYELIGWSTSQDGSAGPWDFDHWGVDASITLYAQWAKKLTLPVVNADKTSVDFYYNDGESWENAITKYQNYGKNDSWLSFPESPMVYCTNLSMFAGTGILQYADGSNVLPSEGINSEKDYKVEFKTYTKP